MVALDLCHLEFDKHVTVGAGGVVLKAFDDGRFCKTPNFNENTGFYGYSAQNEVIATRYLASIGFHPLLYMGTMSRIMVSGKEYTTYVNWSLDYRRGRPDTALADYFTALGVTDKVQMFRTMDSTYLDAMLAADFLVGNRDRRGSNIRWLGDGFAPLGDYNLSLFMPDGTSRLHDILANNYIGSPSLLDNLELIQEYPATHAPDWDDVFSDCDYPYVAELKDWLDWRRAKYEEIRSCHT